MKSNGLKQSTWLFACVVLVFTIVYENQLTRIAMKSVMLLWLSVIFLLGASHLTFNIISVMKSPWTLTSFMNVLDMILATVCMCTWSNHGEILKSRFNFRFLWVPPCCLCFAVRPLNFFVHPGPFDYTAYVTWISKNFIMCNSRKDWFWTFL